MQRNDERRMSMMKRMRTQMTTLLLAAIIAAASAPLVRAEDRQKLDHSAAAVLENLTTSNAAARLLAGKAKAALVFPSIVKAGFMFGGQMGDGVLMANGRPVAYYNSIAASYGLQAGVQVFGYALFFMNDAALAYLDQSHGWEIGVGPSIVVVEEGMGKSLTSTTLTHDVYAFIFDQKGLMAGLGIQGSKITKLSN
jgi:lipid-binding SYLF domain-containing protein